MKRRIYKQALGMLVLFSLFFGACQTTESSVSKEAVDYVNPYMGNISHLLVPTFPTVHLPNSLLRVIPERGDFTGDRLNGLPVVTTSHRGSSAFTISPIQGNDLELQKLYRYSYDQEQIKPYTFSVYLDDENIDVEYAVSHQSGLYSLSFEQSGSPFLLINNKTGSMTVKDGAISGCQKIWRTTGAHQTNIYIYLETDVKPIAQGILEGGKISSTSTSEGKDQCVALQFADNVKTVHARYGISFISEEQAKKNLYREQASYDMETLQAKGRDVWNSALNKTKVEGGSENDRTVFYTSVYRTYERPVCVSEDGKFYSAFDGKVHEDGGRAFYTDDWIWDTYRATHPLRVLTEKELENNILHSYVRMSEMMPNFWFPTFPEINGDTRRMNSNHGVASVLDAHMKGLNGFDLEKAYRACKGAITEKTLAPWSQKPAGELDAYYKKEGYFPSLRKGEKETSPEVHKFEARQPVAVTLGTVYDEWCLSQIAKELGNDTDAEYFHERSFNYRKIYNAETGFFHPKDNKGKFIDPFDYTFSGGMGARHYYGENNGWVYRWDVPHNVADLISLMGGPKSFVNNLETTFNEPLGQHKFSFYAKLPDHTGNVGQFSMANEPSLHIPYLYNYAGQPWKTQKRIKTLIHQWFRNDLMGVPGDEDGGGMSAFVAFSQMGFYPVTPGSPAYNIGSPFFEKSTVDMGDGNRFTIVANNFSQENKYIQSAKLNGKEWNKPWFSHSDIADGATLELEMGPRANKAWGADTNSAPPSAGVL